MNKGKRTGIDFSKHELKVIQNEHVLIHHLKIPDTNMDNIKFINCGGVMSVCGDYGNWIFCREFHPSEEGSVSDSYWAGKLKNSSCQEPTDYDSKATLEALQEKLKEYKEENEGNINDNIVDYYESCIRMSDDHELNYTYQAYREIPSEMDLEDVILVKDYKYWLKAVFDGFEEICRRIKEEKLKDDNLQKVEKL